MKNIARFSESTECVVLDFSVACNQPKEDTTTPYFCNTSVIHQSLNWQHGSSLCIAVDVDEHIAWIYAQRFVLNWCSHR